MVMKLTHAEAVEYVWEHSQTIRDWYTTEHQFDLDDHDRSEYRTSGANAPGDIISSIIQDGITDGIITEDAGEYYIKCGIMTRHLFKAVKYTGDNDGGQRVWVLMDTKTGEIIGGNCPDYARTRKQMYCDCDILWGAGAPWYGRKEHNGYSIQV